MIFNFHQIGFNSNKYLYSDDIRTNPFYFYILILTILFKYKVVHLSDNISKKNASITFDDGDISIYKHLVALNYLKIPFSLFLNNHTNSNPDHFRKFLFLKKFKLINFNFSNIRFANSKYIYNINTDKIDNIQIPYINFYLKYNEILDFKYCRIGLHGSRHERFIFFDFNEQKQNLLDNLNYLHSYFGCKVIDYFAIPYGTSLDYNDDTIRAANSLGLKILFSNNNNYDSRGINRIALDTPTFTRLLINIYKILFIYD